MLKTISPTELNIILNLEELSFQEYFTQVMVHLFCEDILRFEIIEKEETSFMTSIENLIYCTPKLNNFNCEDFEIAFLSFFKVNPKNKIELNRFIKKVYDYQYDNWRKKITTSEKLNRYFNQNYQLNKQGEHLKNELINHFNLVDSGISTSFFEIVLFTNENSKLDFNNSKQKRLFVRNLSDHFDFKMIDLIYQSVIKICSDNNNHNDSLNWGKYNTGGLGQTLVS